MIRSKEPITYPARGASTFAEMKIVRLTAKLNGEQMQVSAVLQNFNDSTQEFDPERHTFAVRIDDLVAVSQVTKRIDNILKELDEVVQLVYNVQFIVHQIDIAKAADEDITQLLVDLDEARDALNADPDVIRAK
jgi:hypothetical protein